MKISVCGKGGSGKSTLVALLANEARSRGYHVLVVDSDESNSGLYRMLGFDHPPVPLMEPVGDKKMLEVRKDLCLGCGLCVESCPRQAISIITTTAEIDQSRCNQCRLCLDVCPQGAIIELASVSGRELQATVTGLKDRAQGIIARIERLKGSIDKAK